MDHMTTDTGIYQLRRELKLTRIACMIASVLMLCLLAGGMMLFGRVRELAEICGPVAEKVSELDVESLNGTLQSVNDSLETVDWEQVADALGELDVDALNSAIDGLDTEELTQTMKNLNEAVEMIRDLSEKMGKMTSWLGGIFDRR